MWRPRFAEGPATATGHGAGHAELHRQRPGPQQVRQHRHPAAVPAGHRRAHPDTQTGLRGYPASMLPWLRSVRGERYEYELNLLLEAKQAGYAIESVDIATVYLDHNSGSHFRPLADSVRIYAPLLKFLASSFAAFLVDTVVFLLLTLSPTRCWLRWWVPGPSVPQSTSWSTAGWCSSTAGTSRRRGRAALLQPGPGAARRQLRAHLGPGRFPVPWPPRSWPKSSCWPSATRYSSGSSSQRAPARPPGKQQMNARPTLIFRPGFRHSTCTVSPGIVENSPPTDSGEPHDSPYFHRRRPRGHQHPDLRPLPAPAPPTRPGGVLPGHERRRPGRGHRTLRFRRRPGPGTWPLRRPVHHPAPLHRAGPARGGLLLLSPGAWPDRGPRHRTRLADRFADGPDPAGDVRWRPPPGPARPPAPDGDPGPGPAGGRELHARLEEVLHGKVHSATIQELDLVNDKTIVDVRYAYNPRSVPPAAHAAGAAMPTAGPRHAEPAPP